MHPVVQCAANEAWRGTADSALPESGGSSCAMSDLCERCNCNFTLHSIPSQY